MRRLLLACALLGLSFAAVADSAPSLSNMDAKEFLAFHDKLARDLETRKYDYVKDSKRRQIEQQQATIRQHLAGQASMDTLDESARLAVFNAHESVVAIMNDAELDKTTCKREHVVGSHRPRMVCVTERERRTMGEAARLNRMKRGACSGPECAGN